MIEHEGQNPELEAVGLHASAMEFADKAEGRLPLDEGDSVDFRLLYQIASGFEQAAFYLIPHTRAQLRSQTALNAVSMAFTGTDYVGDIGFR